MDRALRQRLRPTRRPAGSPGNEPWCYEANGITPDDRPVFISWARPIRCEQKSQSANARRLAASFDPVCIFGPTSSCFGFPRVATSQPARASTTNSGQGDCLPTRYALAATASRSQSRNTCFGKTWRNLSRSCPQFHHQRRTPHQPKGHTP